MIGEEGDTCCVGGTGKGIVCEPDAVCCDGMCAVKGTVCDSTCQEGMISCGGECQLGTADDVCCLGPSGGGIICDDGDQCCSGACVARGEGCAAECHDGLFKCGESCVAGSADKDTCCTGADDHSQICRWPDLCCDGLCRAAGTGCDHPCPPGMVSCGGECLIGAEAHSCCLGPTGKGMVCEPDAECCDGLCVTNGLGCAAVCAEGTIKCGGQCLVAQPGSKCCLGSFAGNGIICGPDSECCESVCVEKGQGCDEPCDEGLYPCGGECLPGNADSKCCVGPNGGGILCDPGSVCCGGLCEAAGSPCALPR